MGVGWHCLSQREMSAHTTPLYTPGCLTDPQDGNPENEGAAFSPQKIGGLMNDGWGHDQQNRWLVSNICKAWKERSAEHWLVCAFSEKAGPFLSWMGTYTLLGFQ